MSDEGYIPLLSESEIKDGEMKIVRAEGKPVLFIKHKGKLYVIDDRCPHMGCKFSGGTIEGGMVVCPCHEWRFSLETGEYENDAAYVLTFYPFMVKDEKVWVKLDEDF